MEIEKKNEILSNVYSNSQEMIRLADSKANISLTIQTLLITIGLGSSILSNTLGIVKILQITNPELFWLYLSTTIIFIITSILGIIITILVYKPRGVFEKTEKERTGFLFFKHILKFPSSKKYYDYVKNIKEEDLLKEYSYQIYQLSSIANVKMRFVNYSIYFMLFNIIYTIFYLILCGYINLV